LFKDTPVIILIGIIRNIHKLTEKKELSKRFVGTVRRKHCQITGNNSIKKYTYGVWKNKKFWIYESITT